MAVQVAPSCAVSLAGADVPYASCAELDDVAQGFKVLWTVEGGQAASTGRKLRQDAGASSQLRLAYTVTTNAWAAVGFPLVRRDLRPQWLGWRFRGLLLSFAVPAGPRSLR